MSSINNTQRTETKIPKVWDLRKFYNWSANNQNSNDNDFVNDDDNNDDNFLSQAILHILNSLI